MSNNGPGLLFLSEEKENLPTKGFFGKALASLVKKMTGLEAIPHRSQQAKGKLCRKFPFSLLNDVVVGSTELVGDRPPLATNPHNAIVSPAACGGQTADCHDDVMPSDASRLRSINDKSQCPTMAESSSGPGDSNHAISELSTASQTGFREGHVSSAEPRLKSRSSSRRGRTGGTSSSLTAALTRNHPDSPQALMGVASIGKKNSNINNKKKKRNKNIPTNQGRESPNDDRQR